MMERALVEYLANVVWQLPLLAGGGWLLIRALRPAALTQHRLWLAVLGLSLLLPLHGMNGAEKNLSPIDTRGSAGERQNAESAIPVDILLPVSTHSGAITVAGGAAHRYHYPLWTGTPQLSMTTENWVAGLYFASVILGIFRIVRAWRNARLLADRSVEVGLSPEKRVLLQNCAHRLHVKVPQLRESAEISSPVVVGVTMPVMLLPRNFFTCSDDEVEAVFFHELAHVKRRDYLVNLLCQVAAVPVAWHPVIHAVRERIGRTREMVCDAIAARLMRSELAYAKCLLAMARSMADGRGITGRMEVPGLFGSGNGNILEERVTNLTEAKSVSGLRVRLARLAIGATSMVAAAAVAATLHISPAIAASRSAVSQEQAQAAPAASPDPLPATGASAASAAPISHADSNVPLSQPPSKSKDGYHRHEWKGRDDKTIKIYNESPQDLTPEERERTEKALAEADRQLASATLKLESPEFKEQMERAQKQALAAVDKLNSPEFKKQMEDARRQVEQASVWIHSVEFKRQMEEAQRQIAETKTLTDTPEFKKQMEDARRQIAEATAQMNSPEFKEQIETAKREAAEVVNTPDFRQQMEDARKQIEEAQRAIKDATRALKESQLESGNKGVN